MMTKNQTDWAISELVLYGKVGRNKAVKNYITRLASVILKLNKAGWVIEGKREKYANGEDYVYSLITRPRN